MSPKYAVKDFCAEHDIEYNPIKYSHTDGSCILLFVSDNKIVAYIEYERKYGDFAQPNIKEQYPSNDVSFKFYREEIGDIYVEHCEKSEQ